VEFPEFIKNQPQLDIPFPADVVETHAVASDTGLAVFFTFHKEVSIPEHVHKAQWGTVIEGFLDLTMNGETKRYLPGESYSIPAGAPHAAYAPAGARIFDVFEEADRYPLKT